MGWPVVYHLFWACEHLTAGRSRRRCKNCPIRARGMFWRDVAYHWPTSIGDGAGRTGYNALGTATDGFSDIDRVLPNAAAKYQCHPFAETGTYQPANSLKLRCRKSLALTG